MIVHGDGFYWKLAILFFLVYSAYTHETEDMHSESHLAPEITEICRNFSIGVKVKKGYKFSSPAIINESLYPASTECIKIIEAPPGSIIRMDFSKFHLENDPLCRHDFLEIRHGPYAYSPPFPHSRGGRYCGRRSPSPNKPLKSNTSILWMRFKTDSAITHSGFHGIYHFEEVPVVQKDPCRKEVILLDQYQITTSNETSYLTSYFPNTNFSLPFDCTFDVATEDPEQYIFAHITRLAKDDCDKSSIELYDENKKNPQQTLCSGNEKLRFPVTFQSAGRRVIVRFRGPAGSNVRSLHMVLTPITKTNNCSSPRFLCSHNKCLSSVQLKCNGQQNCPSGEDEAGCPVVAKAKSVKDDSTGRPPGDDTSKMHAIILTAIGLSLGLLICIGYILSYRRRSADRHNRVKGNTSSIDNDMMSPSLNSKLNIDSSHVNSHSNHRQSSNGYPGRPLTEPTATDDRCAAVVGFPLPPAPMMRARREYASPGGPFTARREYALPGGPVCISSLDSSSPPSEAARTSRYIGAVNHVDRHHPNCRMQDSEMDLAAVIPAAGGVVPAVRPANVDGRRWVASCDRVEALVSAGPQPPSITTSLDDTSPPTHARYYSIDHTRPRKKTFKC